MQVYHWAGLFSWGKIIEIGLGGYIREIELRVATEADFRLAAPCFRNKPAPFQIMPLISRASVFSCASFTQYSMFPLSYCAGVWNIGLIRLKYYMRAKIQGHK